MHVIDQRRVEIEVGYGLEHILTDGRTKRIIDTHTIPYFKQGAFGQGHLETVKVMVSKLEKAEASSTGVLVVDRFIAKPEGPYGKMALQLMGFGLGMWVFWM